MKAHNTILLSDLRLFKPVKQFKLRLIQKIKKMMIQQAYSI